MIPSARPVIGLAASPLKSAGHSAAQLEAKLDAMKVRTGRDQPRESSSFAHDQGRALLKRALTC